MRDSLPLLTHLLPYLEPGVIMPNGAELARIIVELTEHEIEEGGPYASEASRGLQDEDLRLNLTIALFLRRLDVHLPKLNLYLGKALGEQALASDESGGDAGEAEKSTRPEWTSEEVDILDRIRKCLRERMSSLPEECRTAATSLFERTIQSNPDKQMSLMPLYMRQALGRKGRRFSDSLIAELGLANAFFWTAFIVYDDFWDEDEAAEPRYLPIANLFARHYTRFFSTRASKLDALFNEFMDKLDGANAWEIMNCRLRRHGSMLLLPDELPEYGDFGIKFYPAAGHVMGPLFLLLELGYAATSTEAEGLIEYFKHYLIAMQLNDDAHDWKEDLSRGHISTAIALLLGSWAKAHPDRGSIHLERDMPELEHLFWFETLPELCEAILSRTARAQQALDSLDFIENPAPLQQFIDRNRKAAEVALAEQRQSIAFLEGIKSGNETQE